VSATATVVGTPDGTRTELVDVDELRHGVGVLIGAAPASAAR
jgi:hypothetical protein